MNIEEVVEQIIYIPTQLSDKEKFEVLIATIYRLTKASFPPDCPQMSIGHGELKITIERQDESSCANEWEVFSSEKSNNYFNAIVSMGKINQIKYDVLVFAIAEIVADLSLKLDIDHAEYMRCNYVTTVERKAT